MKVEICPCCGQKVQQAHKEQLNKQKLLMLKAAAKHVIGTMKNDFKMREVGDFATDPTTYNNWQKLRYHGLITQSRRADGSRHRDRWLITRNGWAFLRGELALPAYVLIKNNSIVSKSDRTLGFNDVWHGEPCVCTVFEYFDDDGKPVGIRPVAPATGNRDQGRLFDVPRSY